ncbi:MAG: EAL domain-containing protein [Acidobacteria bacterium]|nr:EAL domain-containing protein [Acidobacteriota bacterium]
MSVAVSEECEKSSGISPSKSLSIAHASQAAKIFVARQPIFDQHKRVEAYELLFRSSAASNSYDALDGNMATSAVIGSTMFSFGMEDILRGKRGFFNFTRDHLAADYSGILNPRNTVIEILETVQPDEDVVQACIRLKASGYTLALDDIVAKDRFHPLAEYADIIKVDFRATDETEQQSLAAHFGRGHVTMLAEKVETTQEFNRARKWGYSLFQGYFFARPEVVCRRRIPAFRKHYHDLLRAVHHPDFDFREIESIIKAELSLIYKFFVFVNSPRFGWLSQISSIRHALVLLGTDEVRKWVSLAIVTGLGTDKPPELLVTGAIRARFCELLGASAGFKGRTEHLFMLGMFSVMDAIMEMTLAEVMAGIHMESDVRDTLLGTAGEGDRMALVYRIVLAYERGDWQTVFASAHQLGVDPDIIPPMYVEAVQWSGEVFSAEPPSTPTPH